MSDCIFRHPSCKTQNSNPPTRLLDVSGDNVKLCTLKTLDGAYACLSHCWGSSQIIKTTKANIEDHKRGIPWVRLSRTFQDAITATRLFGMKYLWIDSLCIIQDDIEDWEKEATCMANIYSNSTITFAATMSADGSGGLFHQHPDFPLHDGIFSTESRPNLYARKKIIHPLNMESDHLYEDAFPLFKRGWIFQERLLSSRVLHFGPCELLWECRMSASCECGVLEGGKYAVLKTQKASQTFQFSGGRFELEWKRMLADSAFVGPEGLAGGINSVLNIKRINTMIFEARDIHIMALTWRKIVSDYSKLLMTRQSDRLHALMGLIQQMIPYRKSNCLAGIWTDSLFVELHWLASFTRTPASTTAPTWSWGSVGQYIHFPDYNDFALEPQKVFAKLISVGMSEKTNRNGQSKFKSLDLQISGQLTEVKLADGNGNAAVGLEWREKKVYYYYFHPDSQYWKEGAPRYIKIGTKLWALRTAAFPDREYFIILNIVDESKQIYERVGLFETKGIPDFHEVYKGDEPYKTITII
jgi:hypothetical protein